MIPLDVVVVVLSIVCFVLFEYYTIGCDKI